MAKREEATEVILGLPLRMAGGESRMSAWVREVAAALTAAGLATTLRDERLTTPKGAEKGERDKEAARAILQMELDSRRRG